MSGRDAFLSWAELLPEAMLLVDAEGAIVVCNSAATRLLAPYVGSVAAAMLADLCEEASERIDDFLRNARRVTTLMPGVLTLAERPPQPRLPLRCEAVRYADGSPRALALLRLRPNEDAVRDFVALNQQIKQLHAEVRRRQEVEALLSAEREQLRVTLTGIGDAVIATDIDARITFMNPVAEALTGWTSAEATGAELASVFQIVNESSRRPVPSPVERAIREGAIVGLANHTVLIRKDGSEIHIDDSGAPLRNKAGVVVGAVLVFHDISERRFLEQQVERRTFELEEEHRRKDEFLAMLGHELRNPLAPIKNALQLQSLPNVSAETAQRARATMMRQVDHLTRLVDELLDVARITTGKISLTTTTLEVASVVYRARELCSPMITNKQQKLSVTMDQEPLYVNGDLQRLTQVLSNVINNACKYTPVGGAIELTVSADDSSVQISVADNGMGISSDVLPHVFTTFTQAKRTLARSEGGLGVGLSLVQRLVEQHGGRVTAQSDGEGRGSVFHIALPRVPAPIAAGMVTSPVVSTIDNIARGISILLVEDNVDAATSLAELLREVGLTVKIESSSESAIKAARDTRYDLFILDIGLPDMDGYQLVSYLRRHHENTGAIFVALSGYGHEDARAKSAAAGFNHHLVKPTDFTNLLQIIEQLD